jgi:serine phosphatase RsbU (regulator of sigma subunit)
MDLSERLGRVGKVLEAAEEASPVDAVEAVTRELGVALDATSVSFLIADLSGRALVRLAHIPLRHSKGSPERALEHDERRTEEETATVQKFDGGPAERAVRTQTVQVIEPGTQEAQRFLSGQWIVLAPVTERGEAIGLLELQLPDAPTEKTEEEISRLAHLLAFVVIANRRHTDLFEWGQRSRRFSLSAEIQQRLLPGPRTCEAGAFTLSAWLEPAAAIGGDSFDFSLERDLLHLSITDAMGHGVLAALTATLCVGSLRGTRRNGASLQEQAAAANVALAEHASERHNEFVTGLLARADLSTGVLEFINAGHVAPYLARGDSVGAFSLKADIPLGMFPDTRYRSSELRLEIGDRVVLITDGMLERKAEENNLVTSIAETRSLHPREAVRAMADAVLEAVGHELSDDATVLCLDWHGHHGRERSTVAGADPDRASEPVDSV